MGRAWAWLLVIVTQAQGRLRAGAVDALVVGDLGRRRGLGWDGRGSARAVAIPVTSPMMVDGADGWVVRDVGGGTDCTDFADDIHGVVGGVDGVGEDAGW